MLILTILSDQQSTVLKELRFLRENCESEQLNQKGRLDNIFSSVETIKQMASTHMFSSIETTKQMTSTPLWDAEHLAQIGVMLPQISKDGDRIRREQEVIKSLNYRPRKFRYDNIHDAHRRTFEWVYSPPHDQLRQWLEEDSGIFWLSGKPGSGKSTLMKFIVDDSRTKKALAIWARGRKYITAWHFFWINGHAIQMSQEGLFRSLLYEILKEQPSLVETLCPDLWEKSGNIDASEKEFDQIWSRRSLREAISRLKDCRHGDIFFCFFIDGLDEYQGDHLEMVQTLEELVVPGNIKACVSSRPWNVFADAFGRTPARKVSLQDLTHNDLVTFVQDKLGEHHLWTGLSIEVQDRILTEIVDKAEGVFLWVYLVVKQLRQGLSNGDTVEILQQRVRGFPHDLEEFFSRMMKSIDPLYLSHTARAFQVALHAPKPLPTLLYSFLDDEAENEKYALRLPMQRFDDDALKRRIEKVPRRLEARCKGLLEVTTGEGSVYGEECLKPRVEFIHRTARDFIRTRQMVDLLNESAKDFEPYTSLLRAYLAGIKVLKTQSRRNTLGTDEDLRDMLLDAFSCARSAEDQQMVVDYTVLDEFATTFDYIKTLQGGALPCLDQLVTGVPGASQQMARDSGPDPNPFHVLVLESGLTKYFTGLENLYYTPCGASLLLVCIVHLHFQHPEYGIDIYGSVLAVMEKGADINQTLAGYSTAWAFILRALASVKTREDHVLRQNFSTIAMLLDKGADPNVSCDDGYPRWLDILNSNILSTNHPPREEDAIFRVIQAFIGAGASVDSSPALKMWNRLLDMALLPEQKSIRYAQIVNLLILAVESGADLDPARIRDLNGVISPLLFSRINTAWGGRHDGENLAEPPKVTRQRADTSSRLKIWDSGKEWRFSMLASRVFFLPASLSWFFGLWLYDSMRRIYERTSRRIGLLVESMIVWAVVYLYNLLRKADVA